MEKGREGLRKRDLPYIERVLGAAPGGGYICGGFSMGGRADDGACDGARGRSAFAGRFSARRALPFRSAAPAELPSDQPRTKVAEANELRKA